MEPGELQQLLNAGIQAIRAGDRARGRDLLLRVVAVDERIEPAWLWLSAAVDDPADQLIALENVLALNPNHMQALAGAAKLRGQLAVAEPASATQPAAQASSPPPSKLEIVEEPPTTARTAAADLFTAEDDPLQCAFCGRPTMEADERCPRCGRNLLIPGFWRGGGYQYMLLILIGLLVQSAMVQTAAAYLLAFIPNSIAAVPLSALVAASPLVAATARVVLWAIILVMLLGDSLEAYRWGAIVALADIAWQVVGFALEWVGQELAVVNGLLAFMVALLGLGAVIGQLQARRRLLVVPDRGLSSAPLFQARAEYYARRRMWAMAAIHWQKAIARQPRNPGYYKALGATQAKLGRHAQAVKTFRSGAELAPNDPEFARLIGSVRASTRIS